MATRSPTVGEVRQGIPYSVNDGGVSTPTITGKPILTLNEGVV